MRVNIEISIDTENDAFKGDGGYLDAKADEIKRILTRLFEDGYAESRGSRTVRTGIVTGYERVPLADVNGNTVGFMTVETR